MKNAGFSEALRIFLASLVQIITFLSYLFPITKLLLLKPYESRVLDYLQKCTSPLESINQELTEDTANTLLKTSTFLKSVCQVREMIFQINTLILLFIRITILPVLQLLH